MIKLYKLSPSDKLYHEAWLNGSTIYEHFGVLGTEGTVVKHNFIPQMSKEKNLNAVLSKARENGFEELPTGKNLNLIVEYAVPTMTPEHLVKLRELESKMKEALGWTGLGDCEDHSFGSGTMEVMCKVVDFDLAKDVVRKNLQGTSLSNYSRIYLED